MRQVGTREQLGTSRYQHIKEAPMAAFQEEATDPVAATMAAYAARADDYVAGWLSFCPSPDRLDLVALATEGLPRAPVLSTSDADRVVTLVD